MYGAVMEKERKTVNSAVLSENRSAVRENRTGIPTQLKESMERNTGLSFDDVRVHYNSALPARLDALAYTQGNQVEIGPGQERHLPHELGHVVQQKLGAVRSNATHSSGVALNTDPALEHQADEIGAGKKLAIVQRMRNNSIIQRCGDPEDSPEEEEEDKSQEHSPPGSSPGPDVEVGGGGSGSRGVLIGSLNGLTPDERIVVADLLNAGKKVEIIPRSNEPNVKTPDFNVDGVKTELKTLNGTSKNKPVTRIQEAFAQGAETVIIDARKTEMTLEQADDVMKRVFGIYKTLPGTVEIWTKKGIKRW